MLEMKINEKNLCIFATNPPFDKEGFLNKRGEINKAFQKRYFVLKGNLLFYFEKKGDKEPLGLIVVEGCTIELSEESDQYCFEIAFNGNRTYVLSADSQENMESWMKALTCAGYEYKKLIVSELQRKLDEIEGCKNKITNEIISTKITTTIPKPPPRRQNPFNRPAPPPPSLPLPSLPSLPSSSSSSLSIATRTTTTTSEFVKPSSLSLSFNDDHYGLCQPSTSGKAQFEEKSCQNNTKKLPSTNATDTHADPISATKALSYARSEFYVCSTQPKKQSHKMLLPDTLKSTTVKSKSISPTLRAQLQSNSHLKDARNLNICGSFHERHEQLRPHIMKDILAYHAARDYQNRPLIEL